MGEHKILEALASDEVGKTSHTIGFVLGVSNMIADFYAGVPAWWVIDSWTEVAAIVSIVFSFLNYFYRKYSNKNENV